MRGIRRPAVTAPVAVLLAVLLACAAGWLALTRLPVDRQLERWLRAQPDVTSVELRPTSALAAGRTAVQVARPDVRVGLSVPLSVDRVGRFMAAYEAFTADHAGWRPWSVELRQGPDAVLVAGRGDNAVALGVLRSMRARPEVESVRLSLLPYPAALRAGVRPGSDPVATAAALSAALPDAAPDSSVWRNALLVTQDAQSHEVWVESGARPSPRAGLAFAEAVRRERDRSVELRVTGSGGGADDRSALALDPSSPTAAGTAAAVSALGFGMAGHGESIRGPAVDGGTGFDEPAWAAGLARRVSTVRGVRAATPRAARVDDTRSVPTTAVLDVRATTGLDWARLATTVPGEVDLVEVHTQAAAPDYARDVALPEDPELLCPGPASGSTNLAYSGPPGSLVAAAALVASLRRVADPTCVHWREVRQQEVDRSQLSLRIPLRPDQWRPVIDLLVARQRTTGAPLDAQLLLQPPEAPWTAALLLRPGTPPYPSSVGELSPRETAQAQAAVAPVIAYWRSRSGVG